MRTLINPFTICAAFLLGAMGMFSGPGSTISPDPTILIETQLTKRTEAIISMETTVEQEVEELLKIKREEEEKDPIREEDDKKESKTFKSTIEQLSNVYKDWLKTPLAESTTAIRIKNILIGLAQKLDLEAIIEYHSAFNVVKMDKVIEPKMQKILDIMEIFLLQSLSEKELQDAMENTLEAYNLKFPDYLKMCRKYVLNHKKKRKEKAERKHYTKVYMQSIEYLQKQLEWYNKKGWELDPYFTLRLEYLIYSGLDEKIMIKLEKLAMYQINYTSSQKKAVLNYLNELDPDELNKTQKQFIDEFMNEVSKHNDTFRNSDEWEETQSKFNK